MKISDVLKKWTPEEEEEETSVKRTGVSSANNSGNVKSKMKVSDVTDKWNRSYTVATDKHRKPEERKTKWTYTFTQPEDEWRFPEPEAQSQTGVGGMAQGFYWGDNWTGDGSGRTWSALGDREMMTDKQRALADRLAEYNTLSTRPDFKKYSTYDPSLVDDPLYGAVNGDRQAQIALQKEDPEGLRAMIGTDKSFARQMNPYELSRYNYIRTTRGAEAADQYLEDIRSDLQSRQMDERLSKAEAFADRHPVGAQLLSYAMPSELGIYGAVGDWAKGEKLDPNAGYRTWSRMQTALRSADSSAVEREVSLHFGEAAGKLAGKGYNLLTSYSDSRINQLMFPGMEAVPLLRMGAQAASHALDEAQARGLNDNRALALSLIAGAAEVATEQYSLEALLNADPVNEGMIRTLFKQMAAEGSEEMASEAINAVADYMISGDKAEARQSYFKHINEDHMSPEKARLAVCAEIAGQIVESGIGGALMGGLGGVTIAGMSELGAYQTGRDLHTMTQSYEVPGSRFQHAADWGDVQRGVITAAQQQPVGTRAKTLGDQARAKIDAGGQLSDLEFGRLYTALDAQQQALQERTDERVREKLQQQGEDIERQTQDTLLDLARDKVAEETGVDMTQAVEEAPAESRQNEARAAETAQKETARAEEKTSRSEERSEAAEVEDETEFVELGGEENEAAFAELQGEEETRAEAPQTQTQERTSPSLRTMNTRMTEAYKEAFDPAQLEKVKSAFGEAGQKALTDNYKGEQMTAPYVRGFMAFYNAGLTGTRASDVSLGARTLISTDTAVRAWAAGRQDAQAKTAQLKAQKGSVAVVQNPGIDYSDAKTSEWAAKNGETARRVNQLTKALGMSMTVEDIIRVGKTGEANAQLLNARLTLSNNAEKRTATYRGENISNPVMWTIGHEVGHRLRELAPEAFDALTKTMPQEAVRDIEWQQYAYAKAGVDEKFESAAEEAAANYVADLLEGGQVLDEFIDRQTRAGNRNVLQKLGDMIRRVYRDVKAYLSGDEARAIRQSIKKLEAALDAAAEQAKKNAKNGVTAEAKATQQALYHDATTAAEVEASGPDYSLVMDQALLDRLNSEDTVTVYRAMQLIDGELYPPMAAKVKSADGKKTLVEPTKIGDWYQADEHPELVKNGKFELDKGNGSSINAAYNPYFHTSASPLNDQFSSAYDRPNLVVVEGVIPRSELTSGYRAEGAKDSVGETRWHSGPVASQLKGDKARRVFLSRWFQAQRIVPDAEVAGIVAETLRGENISVPENVVTPGLRDALREAGVEVGPAQARYRDAVAKKNAAQGGVKFSLKDIVGEKKDYGQGVLLDTNLFDGIAPRNWGRVLGDYVYKNLAGTQMVMYDEAGNEKTVTFARLNDRVRKDGAKNSHKVIDKLARYTGDNVKALATIHLSEMLRASGNESHTDEHNHQWLDENGWTYRTAYLQTRDGNIYEATLNIANGRDRDILYAISNVKQIDKSVTGGVVPSTGTEGARTTSRNASDRRVPHPDESVKGEGKFSLKQRDDAYATAVERGDMDEAQQMVDEAAKAAGYDTPRLYHGTRAFGFTEFDASKSDDGISFFATDSPMTARTYSGETDRNRIKDAARINVDNLRGEALLEEAKKQPRLQRYKDYRLMRGEERQRLIEEERRGITLTAQDAADFINDHEGAFDADKMAVMDRLLNALSDVSTARDEDSLQEAWDRWSDAMWDLKWMDESIQMEFIDAIGNRQLQVMKNHLDDFMYNGDIFIEDDEYSFSYVFDNQVALELDAELHKGVYELYGKTGNQLVIDANGSNWNQITAPDELNLYGPQRTRDIAVAAKANGYDSVLFKNLRDNGGETAYNGESNVYIFFNASDLKSADPVTYDDDGNVIPLSERFNQKRDDIRYSIKRDFSNVTPATRQESMDLDATDDRNVARYQNEVTQVLDGTMRSNQLVLLGRPSDILKKYLGSDKALYMPQSAVKKAALPKESGGKHGLGRVVVDELPYQFADPMAITGNTTEHVEKGDNSIVVWTNWKTVAGNSIIVPIRIDAKGKLGIYNNVNTAFDVNTEVYYNDLLREGNVLYTRDNKSIRELLTQRRYVPKWEQANASGDSVPQGDRNVNYSLKGTETQREIAELREQVDRLRTNVERWKTETKRSDRQAVDPKAVERTARALAKEYTGSTKGADITKDLESLYNFISHGGDGKDELTFESAFDRALAIADTLIENAVTQDDEAYREYEALRRYCRETPFVLGPEDAANITDYSSWAKGNRGRLRVKRGDRTNVDSYYQEMAQEWPEFFDPDITDPADQIQRIRSVLDGLYTINEYNPFSEHMEDAKLYAANDIMDRFWDVPNVKKTFADRAEERLIRETAKWRERAEQNVQTERQKREEAVQRLKDHYKEVKARASERKADSQARTRLLKIAKRLQNKKLPAAGRALLDQYIGDLDTVSKSITGKTLDNLHELEDWYRAKTNPNSAEYDPDFIPDDATLKKLERLHQRRIADMTVDEVADLTDILLNIENELRTSKQLIDQEDRRNVYHMGEEVIKDIYSTKGNDPGVRGAAGRFIATQTLSPVRLMHKLTGYNDADPMYKLTQALNDGQRAAIDYERRAKIPFRELAADKAFNKMFSGKDADTIQVTGLTKDGARTVTITPAMRVSLYLHSLNNQNLRHIRDGGITVPDAKLYAKGNIQEAYNRGVTIKLDPSQVRAITSRMTPKEREFARLVHNYFNGMSRTEINEVSEKLKGYSLAQVEDYFPIKTDRSFGKGEFESMKFDGTIEGMGWTKERQTGAANPIMLMDVNRVLDQSISQHAKYVGLAIPVRNFNKVWGVTTASYDAQGNRSSYESSVQQALKQRWGGTNYDAVEKMMTDLQNPRSGADNPWSKALSKLQSNYAGAVLTLNGSVAIKQTASYPTAAAVLGWEPLAKAMKDFGKVNLDLIEKYTPLQWYRSQGFSTRELGDMAKNPNAMNRLLSKPALNWVQGMDVLTTRKLWKASEYYVQANNKDVRRGTDEYYKAVADIYNRVIEETQPNYTTMQRPNMLRSDNDLLRAISMFKTQPFQNFNVIYDAAGNLRAKLRQGDEAAIKQAKREFGWAVTSQAAQLAVFAGMTMLWQLFRGKKDKYDDDDGEVSLTSMLTGLSKDMIAGAASIVPFGGEAWEMIASKVFGEKYYGLDVSAVETVNDAVAGLQSADKLISDMAQKIVDGEPVDAAGTWIKLKKVLGNVSKIAGAPVDNVLKLSSAIYRRGAIAAYGRYLGEYKALTVTSDPNTSTNRGAYYDLLYKASQNDQKQYVEMYKEMLESGAFTADQIKSGMEDRMKKAEGVNSVKDLSHRFVAPK